MASLSNINGLFDVHSTGAILFSNTHGTSGQILRSNGNAAPTWVAASTVIGGPYLPLTGGTLTGPLSGTSATFSDNIYLADDEALNFGTSNAFNLRWNSTAASGQGASIIDSNRIFIETNFFQLNSRSGTPRLTISGSTSTFAGNVDITSGIIELGQNKIDGSSDNLKISADFGGVSGSSTIEFLVDGSEKMRINNSGNVGIGTTLPGQLLHLNDGSTVTTADANNMLLLTRDNHSYIMFSCPDGKDSGLHFHNTTDSSFVGRIAYDHNSSGDNMLFTVNSSERMRIDSSGRVGINTTVFPSSGFAKLVVNGGAIAARPSGVNDYFSYIKSNWAMEDAFEIGIEGNGVQHRFITSGNYYDGTELRFWTSDTRRVTINSVGSVGIGTPTPAASAKLTVMGNQTFGLPGNGTNTSGRFISIEGNTDGSGEGSSRIFFSEHNSTTAAMDNYGMSLGYRGGATSIVGASGNTWTGLTQIGNGQWGMWGHNNNATGSLVMFGDRAATYVSIPGNVGIGETNPGIKLTVKHTDDTFNDLDLLQLKRIWSTASGSDRSHGISFNDTNATLAKIYANRYNSGSNYGGKLEFYVNLGTSGTSVYEAVSISNTATLQVNPQTGSYGVRQNGVSSVCNSGYIPGNGTLLFTYEAQSQGSMFIECVFNHYGLISGYGCSRVATMAIGPNLTIQDIQNITTTNGGSWTFNRVSNSRFTVAKTAGTYGGGGYYFINIRGNGVQYT